jgi:uncharacterized protein (DUF983 family)
MNGQSSAAVLAGLKSRCPQCGRGALFDGYLKFAPRCPDCGADFAVADTGDGAAVFVMFVVGAIVVPAAFIFQFAFHWPSWATITVVSVMTIALCLALLRPFKAVLFALQWRHKAAEARNE